MNTARLGWSLRGKKTFDTISSQFDAFADADDVSANQPGALPIDQLEAKVICAFSYERGHSDATRDLQTNALAQVPILQRQLQEEHQRRRRLADPTAAAADRGLVPARFQLREDADELVITLVAR